MNVLYKDKFRYYMEETLKKIAIFLLLGSFAASANVELVREESTYLKIQQDFLGKNPMAAKLMHLLAEPKLSVDVIEDLSVSTDTSEISRAMLNSIDALSLPHEEGFRVELLRLRMGIDSATRSKILDDVVSRPLLPPSSRVRLLMYAFRGELADLGLDKGLEDQDAADNVATPDLVSDLFNERKDLSRFSQGKYQGGVFVFLLCRSNRSYPCLMVMKDSDQKPVLRPDGSLWTQPSLASAVTGFPPTQRNGHTPAGVFVMDSVMPYADQQLSYGKFRRVMLDFAPSSADEQTLKQLLPASSHSAGWWQQSVAARDIGRNLFRVHGTGRINTDPTSTFYPLTQTHGCISKRENTYEGVTYKDQRDFLDILMLSMGLEPKFANEPKIKGILYLVEVGDEERAVTEEDLPGLGITASL